MSTTQSQRPLSRRQFLHRSTVAGAALSGLAALPPTPGAAAADTRAPDGVSAPTRIYPAAEAPPPAGKPVAPGEMPCGRIGRLTLSRIISGGNILSGWCHQRDLLYVRRLAEAYLTPAKQHATLQLLEESGVNAIMIDLDQLPIIQAYKRQRGGKIQTLVSVRQDWGDWDRPRLSDLKTQIRRAIDQGADTLFLHGGYCDRLVKANRPELVELIGLATGHIREQGCAAGVGSHALEVPIACAKEGIEPDYYVKTFHHDRYWSATPKERRRRFCVDGPRSLDHNEFHDNIFCIDPEETIAFMRHQKAAWIAFKVLAAGAIPPQSAFTYGFENGADFLAVGMFDFEVAEDIRVAREVLREVKRERPWVG